MTTYVFRYNKGWLEGKEDLRLELDGETEELEFPMLDNVTTPIEEEDKGK